MGILGTVACFLYRCYTEHVLRKYITTCLLFIVAAFSCGTKEIAVITPALVLLVDWFFVARGCTTSLKSRLLLHIALFTLIIGLYIKFLKPSFFTDIIGLQKIAKNNFGNVITHNGQDVIQAWPFFISQFKVILHYIAIFVWPFSISVEYDWMLCKNFFSIDCLLPFLALLSLGIACMRLLYKQPTHIIGFGMLWFFFSIAPRSSIIPSPELLVDYKTYTASVGWLLILSCACIKGITLLMNAAQAKQDVLQTKSGHALFLMLSIVPFSYMTQKRNHVWSSGLELWMNIMQCAPNKARAYNNYAFELAHTHQRYNEAIPYFKRAARMDRNYPEPLNNLAVCYSKLKQVDKAIVALQQSLHIYPQSPEGHSNLALFYIEKKEYAAAEQHLLTALHLRPYYGSAYINLGTMYTALNKPLEALDAYKKACTIADLDNEYGYQVYARAAFSQQNYAEAIWGLERALAHNPDSKEALFSLAGCYLRSQQITKARTLYEQLLVKHSDDKRIQFNLGETYVAEENYTQAFAYFNRIDPEKDNLPQTRLRLAQCYEKSGNLVAARNELEQAMCNNANNSATHINAHTSLNRLNAYYTT
jgi:tetratricopeptide (TPR) repeat protein